MAVDVRLFSAGKRHHGENTRPKGLVAPGDVITTDAGFMRGHGTYIDNEQLLSSVAGAVEKVNKLITVRPLKTRRAEGEGVATWFHRRFAAQLTASRQNLGQGTLVLVSPSLIKRCKTHFHNLPCGAQIILGNNGYVWICPLPSEEGTKFVQSVDVVICWVQEHCDIEGDRQADQLATSVN
ncbi:hypothetical protein HPB51_010238 [Rhipicephalus microplus]|uniref:Ribosomal RNA-processing protein 4 n=1 Tax=Rhipicephalus microplus TaxID=6941 RepID=A0A9J6EG99_RHIMP|nr:hypothetical protein HPB51_010238 [Rhipicephalus microplus]